MHDTFDLREGYLLLQHGPVKAFAGRQELKFGNERLIGVSDFTNNSRTFDGFDLRLGDKNRLDLFSTSVVTTHPSSLDTHGAGLTFHGAYGQVTTWIPKTSLQPFVIMKAMPNLKSRTGVSGPGLEVTVGAEVEGSLPAGFDYEALGAIQRGSFSSDSVHASAGIIKVAYSASKLPWAPRIGTEFDYASGNTGDKRIVGTFDQQYPSNHNAFGLTDLLGFQNIRQERINLDLAPSRNLSLLVQGELLNLASRQDSVYGSSGTALVPLPANGFASTAVGKEVDFSGKYVYRGVIVFNAGIAHLVADSALKAGGLADNGTSGYFSVTYRFRVSK
jgi:hypothetical protein